MTTVLPRSGSPVQQLIDSIALDPAAPDTFRSRPAVPLDASAVFGGQIVAQALSAAARTVPREREPHSLHGYFVYRGDPAAPITYRVERLRDGHSFTVRRVVAVQLGRTEQEIFHLTASFKSMSRTVSRPGANHQDPMEPAPAPHRLPRAVDEPPAHVHPGVVRRLSEVRDAIDLRYVREPSTPRSGPPSGVRTSGSGTVTRVWFRVRELPPGAAAHEPALHHCLVAYLSDLTLLDSGSPCHRTGSPNDGSGSAVSLDHAMWFHRPLSADEWLLYEQRSPSFADGRALIHARIYQADGTLVASVVQEGAIRPGRTPGAVQPAAPLPDDPEIDPFSWAVAKPETD
ncbi:acyl-CoA thioesterase [Streptomyces jumonjinensis]|uniref:acyl-CoA thioesterase n=1 Tax=Streptomyces jumonjinensis TaxID=1945 RepID=UPI0037B5BE87